MYCIKNDLHSSECNPGIKNQDVKKNADVCAEVKQVPPKPVSWAALFKNTSSPSPGLVIKSCASAPLRSESAHVGAAPLMSEEPTQTTVPLEEDKLAHKLAGIDLFEIWQLLISIN